MIVCPIKYSQRFSVYFFPAYVSVILNDIAASLWCDVNDLFRLNWNICGKGTWRKWR